VYENREFRRLLNSKICAARTSSTRHTPTTRKGSPTPTRRECTAHPSYVRLPRLLHVAAAMATFELDIRNMHTHSAFSLCIIDREHHLGHH
jgi:hypothetical protein